MILTWVGIIELIWVSDENRPVNVHTLRVHSLNLALI